MGYKGYRNYQRNEIIYESITNLTFSDPSSKFKKLTYSDSEFEFNNSLLKSISKIKDSITTEFLNKTDEKILFFALDIDTLDIKKVNGQKYSYSSRLDKGIYDKKFNDLLFNSLEPLLSKNGIDEIEVYTLTPTEYKNIPPPHGTLANFDIEKEFNDIIEKLEIDN
ncbi:hypothetical protein CSW08_13935 [Confluentibacter flavum]|uniref:Uncharacterized protein n=1 Tax=Confluentibacter flavum TaxID=1909700 RepID=A0A2N3HHB4_9FLAO|nr:hypothetical protein CSW08_13935 [Confluentibacter flavum]